MPSYPVMGRALAEAFVPFMEAMDVSEVARSRRGFFHNWGEHGARVWPMRDPRFGQRWDERRDNFVARHLAQYERNPTVRRFLALVAWAYTPLNTTQTRALLAALRARNTARADEIVRRNTIRSHGRSHGHSRSRSRSRSAGRQKRSAR